jgi:FKBP-type peptidyl-prolyl cis-trans isomerase FkpA
MKRILILALCISLLSGSCKKEDACPYSEPNQTAPATEVQALQLYLAGASITNATAHPSGLYYIVTNPGSGNNPGQCSGVAVKYTGRLTSGFVFEQQTSPVAFTLGGLIAGWRIGIPIVKNGGIIRLFIPPSLGYGNQAVGNIPANSILIFDIELTNVF